MAIVTSDGEDEADVVRLTRRIHDLQERVDRLQSERDRYLHALYAWSRNQLTKEQLHAWATTEDKGISFAEVLADLRASPTS